MSAPLASFLLAAATQANSVPTARDSGDALAQWVLIGVTAATAAFIWYQARETRLAAEATRDSVNAIKEQAKIMERQTIAGEQAAQAATDSTKALANIERAWVDIRLIRENAAQYTVQITNCGRTVAHIKELMTCCTVTPAKMNVVFTPSSDKRYAKSKLLVPNNPWPVIALDLTKELGIDTFHQIRAGSIQLHYRCVVRYASISPNCESECLYYYNSAQDYQCLVPVEASEYNKHT